MLIIDDILLAPVKGFLWICKKIQGMAEEELTDTEEKLKRELLDLQMLFETDQITEEKYKRKEDEILAKLEALREKAKSK